jgi:hypothetical protein
MVVLGLLVLVALVIVAAWLLSEPPAPPRPTAYQARAAIREVERQTIRAMRQAEREAQAEEAIDGAP